MSGITLTEIPHRLATNPETFSTRSVRKDAVDDIFDVYANGLPILLPREHGAETDATTLEHSDQYSDLTELSEVSEEPLHSSDFYSLTARESDGQTFHFDQLRGKYVLITNIATGCSMEWQTEFLEELHRQHEEDLVVIGFPSNSFLQNWKSAQETKQCFSTRYDCTFKMMEKVKVNGGKTHEVFKYLKNHKAGSWGLKSVKWNFEKFLINREGDVVKRYTSGKHPHAIKEDLEMLLAQEKKNKFKLLNKKRSSKRLTNKDGNADGSMIQRLSTFEDRSRHWLPH